MDLKLVLENTKALFNVLNKTSIFNNGYLFFTVNLLSSLQSMYIRINPLFFFIKRIGAP